MALGAIGIKELVALALRFNPPPGWPLPPKGFTPAPGWQPDPSWPPAPPGWQLWVADDESPAPASAGYGGSPVPGGAGYGSSASAGYGGSPVPGGADYGASASAGYGGSPMPTAAGWDVPSTGWPVTGPSATTSGSAIAAFVLGLFGLIGITAILAIVLGILALRRIGATLQRGKGLAIAGIVLGGVWLVLVGPLIFFLIIGASTPAQPTPSAAATPSGQSLNVFSLVAGDCFNNPTDTPGQVTNVSSVVQTSCTAPHNAQIFATFDVNGSILDYPGSAKLTSIASSGCNARAKAALNSAMITSSMTIRLLFPLQQAWLSGERTISCIIYSPASELRSSVLKS